jgi:chitin disaccharide deacetylase
MSPNEHTPDRHAHAGARAQRRTVVLCADDYGISPGVSRGIRELLAAGRLSATSCMVDFPEFRDDGPALAEFAAHADIGLHVTLTIDRSLPRVMADAYLRRFSAPAIATEIDRQLDAFVRVMGRAPDHLDGHQHVHVLPVVRDAVCMAAARVGAYIRNLHVPLTRTLGRPSAIASAGLSLMSRRIAKDARTRSIDTNVGFTGTRAFGAATPYREVMRRMIAGASDGELWVCHPGWADATLASRDGVTTPREDELRYLASAEFAADLAAAGIALGRLRRGGRG